jgi:DNA repair protein RecO
MLTEVTGLVIREISLGESDKILTILTPDLGKITVYANGVRKYKNPNLNSAQLFCLSEFIVNKRGDRFWLKESNVIESFHDIRLSLNKSALAQYIVDVVGDVCLEGEPEETMLRLTLNTLYMLIKSGRPDIHVKAVYELRTAANLGFLPDLIYCNKCGKYETDYMYFNVMNAVLLCENCIDESSGGTNYDEMESFICDKEGTSMIIKQLPLAVVKAMRHVVYSDPNRIFSFRLSDELYSIFADVCESYLLNHIERGFKTLDFYKKLRK